MKKTGIMVSTAVVSLSVCAAVELGAPFSDHAVLQRGMKVPVWGTATAGNEVTVSFAGEKATATAGADGKWLVRLPEMTASKESRELVATEREPGWFGSTVDTKVVGDVLVGEVWFACGQSNTECPIWHDGNSRYRDGKGAMMTAMTRLPNVRFIKTPRAYGTPGRNPLKVEWKTFEPENFVAPWNSEHWKLLSGVAWYYARELYLALNVPIGIIDSSIGGTNIDAWTPRAGYENCDPSLRPTADYKLHFGKEWNNDCATKVICAPFQQPTVLFNAMVWDYAPMAMRGLIWYQGCHNAGESELYCAKMHALYAGWSRVFENPDLKLYFAQLAPWKTSWLGLCMAQTKFAEEEKNAAIAVTADVGNFNDIHPNDKETVAQRLALHALKRDYGFNIPEDDSPVAKRLTVKDGVATVTFDHVKTWYVYNRDMSLGVPFELAGTNGVWKAAKLVECGGKFEPWQTLGLIDHPELKLRSDEVAEPVAVRYMGRDRTVTSLYNQASLPLGPFELRVAERTIPIGEFRDRMMGAWLGQSAGVAFGAPTEFKCNGTVIPADKMPVWKPELVNNTFEQDDLYVEMTFIDTLMRRGLDVTPRAAGLDFANSRYRLWCANLNARNNLRNGIAAPASSHPKFHPTTDDIDYQIEADFSGVLAPGLPQAAVDFGETFGRIMNYGDGLYAGQFVGALYAEAYFETDRVRLVEKALKAIPSESKYAGMVRDMLAWHAANPTCWQTAWTNAVEKYFRTKENIGRVSNAQINVKVNGAMVLLGLLYGDGDMDRTMYIATAGGFDSDCNPSSACGVLGTMIGFKRLEAKYFAKLDRTKKWEFTDFTWDGLVAASDRLVRQIVVKYGGRIEKDASGIERFVLPVVRTRPSAFFDSSAPGPAPSDEKLTDGEREEIRYLPSKPGTQSVRKGGKET